jgi:hypothetical protein
MPRYFFNVEGLGHSGGSGHDPDGTEFLTDTSAFDYAQRIIRELKDAGDYNDPSLMMVVKLHSGRTVFAIPFDQQLQATPMPGRP